jgi:hypothetical protein
MSTVNELDGRLGTHEAVCAERYSQINARLKRIEKILMWAAGAFMTGGCAMGFAMMQMIISRAH